MEYKRIEAAWKQRKHAAEQAFFADGEAFLLQKRKQLKADPPEQAADAAEALGWVRDGGALPLLLERMASPDEWLRDRCSFAIGRMPRMGLPLLLANIEGFEGPQLEHAIKAIVRMKSAGLASIMEWLASDIEKRRMIAHKVLCQVQFPVANLRPILDGENASSVKLSIDILGKSRSLEAVGLLEELYQRPQSPKHQVEVAMSALARHLAEEIHELAFRKWQDGAFDFLAWQALAKRGFPPAFDTIAAFLLQNLGKLTGKEVLLLRNYPDRERSELFLQIAEADGRSALRAVLELMLREKAEPQDRAKASIRSRAAQLDLLDMLGRLGWGE